MLYLPLPSQKHLDDYFNSIEKKITKALGNPSISNSVRQFLTKKKIKEIITDSPDNLLQHHIDLMPLFVLGFNTTDYDHYFEIKKKKANKRTDPEKILFNSYSEINKIFSVFDYEKYISSSKKTSYNLASELNRNTCTYCNRLYTNTVISKSEKTKRINDKGRITRPQFDHWFAKSRYPCLSLSYFNLIPSCSVCNSSIKGDSLFSLNTHIHPYIKEIKEEFKFSYNYENVHDNNVKIIVVEKSKIDTTLKEFKITEVYNAHSNLELKDLLELRYKYSENYLNTLLNNTFSALGVGQEEVYRLIFGIEIEENNFHKRPFSKFKKDILQELKIIK